MARKHHLGPSEEEWAIRSLQPISAVTEAKANLKKTWGLPRNRNSASGFSGGFAFQELAVVLLRERERGNCCLQPKEAEAPEVAHFGIIQAKVRY